MQINKSILYKGVLPFAALSITTGCVDNNYDLSDIDTTSRVTVNDLTVPVTLSEIKLENILDLDDNENISKLYDENGNPYYAISKGGNIETNNFNIATVSVAAPQIPSTQISVTLPTVPSIPGMDIDVPAIDLPASPLEDYKIEMKNVDSALKTLNNVKTNSPIAIDVELTVNPSLGNESTINFESIQLQLPWGLITTDSRYNSSNGLLSINNLEVKNGKASINFQATGLDLGNKGAINNGYLGITGKVGILSGKIKMTLKNATIPSQININANYKVSAFTLASFSGQVDYKMSSIDIAPITLNDLPDFLDSPETVLRIAAPQILVSLDNPVGNHGLSGTGKISLTSNFKNGSSTNFQSDPFTIAGNHTDLAFGTDKIGYTFVPFPGLGDILASNGQGLPQSINVHIDDIVFAGTVSDFPLGQNLGDANGNYEFAAPLGFADNSQVIYETTEDGWGSDDLDDVNINKLHVTATCKTNLPVGIHLEVFPIDKNGNNIPITENSGLTVAPMSDGSPISLNITGANGPIKNLDGVRFKATIDQNSGYTQPIGPDLYIILTDLRATVDGYYETSF